MGMGSEKTPPLPYVGRAGRCGYVQEVLSILARTYVERKAAQTSASWLSGGLESLSVRSGRTSGAYRRISTYLQRGACTAGAGAYPYFTLYRGATGYRVKPYPGYDKLTIL
jgi:hypothetical protein